MLREKIGKLIKLCSKIALITGMALVMLIPTKVYASIKPFELSESSINYYNDKKVVVIEPGHMGKGYDIGAVAIDGRYEADMTLELAKDIEKELKKEGVEVYLTRAKTEKNTLGEVIRETNSKKPDLSLQIHFNSAENKEATGAEIFYNTATYDQHGNVVVKDFSNTIADSLNIVDRGAKQSPFYNRKMNEPAILIENCFISNEEDLVKYDKNKDTLVKKITQKIINMVK